MILPKLTKKNKKVNKKRTLIKKNKKVNKKLRGGADITKNTYVRELKRVGGVEHYEIENNSYQVTYNENNIIVSKDDNQGENSRTDDIKIEKENFTFPSKLYEKDSYIECKTKGNNFNLKCIDITSENAKFIVVNEIPDGEKIITVTKTTE